MKLSEAIRLGSMLRPKAVGYFFQGGASCAQGAALEAVGVAYDECRDEMMGQSRFHNEMAQRWRWALKVRAICPVCRRNEYVMRLLPHLNNEYGHNWTREAIAEWVASVEPQDPSVTEDAVSVQTAALASPVRA